MTKIAGLFATPYRKSAFATTTTIAEDEKRKYVIKNPILSDANAHVAAMLETYEILHASEALSSVNIVPPQRKGAGIVFPFIEGRRADKVLMDHFLSKNMSGVKVIVDKVSDLIAGLPSSKLNPTDTTDFVHRFGDSYNKDILCSNIGLIDLNLDNFIIDNDGSWHLYDYEWFFNFPVPKDYLLRRFIYWFLSVNLGSAASMRMFNDSEFLEIGEDILVPSFFVKRYKKYLLGAEEFIYAETEFQNYVNAETRKTPLWNKEPHKIKRSQAKEILNSKKPSRRLEELDAAYLRLEETYLATREQLDQVVKELRRNR